MSDEIQQVRTETYRDDGGVVTERNIKRRGGDSSLSKAQQIVYVITGLLTGLLGLRVILSLLGANRGNGFADLIYGVSYPFVAPFFGLFGKNFQRGVGRLEVETLFAIVVYLLIGWAIISILSVGKKNSD